MKTKSDIDNFKELIGKTIKKVTEKENGCILIFFTDGTYIGIYNKGEFAEESFELGINLYNV
ncbi:hypothetical protein Q7A53_05195 [Halobacillus rhizosphaerae]|uniref:hypothetical protein n=1 Tax=Halobacillus rhizosphaerae TaxID=3064889 RepID=UPI00398B62E2